MTKEPVPENAGSSRKRQAILAAFHLRRLIIGVFVAYPLNYLFYNLYAVFFLHSYVTLSGNENSAIDIDAHHGLFMLALTRDCLLYVPVVVFTGIAIGFFGRVFLGRFRRTRRQRTGGG